MMKDHYKEISDAKVVSICFNFNLKSFEQGDIRWVMFDSKDKAIERQTTKELDRPTVLQHFDVVKDTDQGFVLELQEGKVVRVIEVEQDVDPVL